MILGILSIIVGVLNIILFFKIWGMTNDMRAVKNLLEKFDQEAHAPEKVEEAPRKPGEIRVNDLVTEIKSGKLYRVIDISDEGYECRIPGCLVSEIFRKDEIQFFK